MRAADKGIPAEHGRHKIVELVASTLKFEVYI